MDINASNRSFITDRMTAISNCLTFSSHRMYVAVILLCTVLRVKAIEIFEGAVEYFPACYRPFCVSFPYIRRWDVGGSVSIYFGGGEEHNDGIICVKGILDNDSHPPP